MIYMMDCTENDCSSLLKSSTKCATENEDKPKCGAENEELVQIPFLVPGSYGVATEALAEIASRFRAKYLRDTKPGTEVVPRGGRYEPFKRKYNPHQHQHQHPPPSYLAPPPPPREYQPHSCHAPPVEYATHAYPVPSHASGKQWTRFGSGSPWSSQP
ncbi:hypothetical protein Lser_V15G29172 [Lactuca serriola]